MTFISKILPTYTYNYFDRYHQLQNKRLNIFQILGRKFFGFYAETHLSNVTKKAYLVTLNDQFHASAEKQQQLLELISKANSVHQAKYRGQPFYCSLTPVNLISGKKFFIGISYDIKKSAKDTDLKISSINFRMTFTQNDQIPSTHYLSIFKNKSERIVVCLPPDALDHKDDSIDSLKRRLTSEYTQTIHHLLAKVLNDSTTEPEMAEIHQYRFDHQEVYRGFATPTLIPSNDPENLNLVQKDTMQELGWEYLQQFRDPVPTLNSIKRVYVFRKEAAAQKQTFADLKFKQQLSMAFAARFLETKNKEF